MFFLHSRKDQSRLSLRLRLDCHKDRHHRKLDMEDRRTSFLRVLRRHNNHKDSRPICRLDLGRPAEFLARRPECPLALCHLLGSHLQCLRVHPDMADEEEW
jgi:hypothetical protein